MMNEYHVEISPKLQKELLKLKKKNLTQLIAIYKKVEEIKWKLKSLNNGDS